MLPRHVSRSIPSTWLLRTHILSRSFTLSQHALTKPLPPRPIINEADIEEAFLRGSGPGGQKINKTSCAVQLKHLPTGLVVKSQETRSRSQNRKIARRVLAEKLEFMEKGPESRTGLKAEAKRKKKANRAKKAKRKYGAADDAKVEVKAADGEEADEVDDDSEEDEVERGKDTAGRK